MTADEVPAGYTRLVAGGAEAVARADAAPALGAVLERGRLYDWAAAHPARRELAGRAPAYAVPLGDRLRVVVRHSRHGGLLAPITGDRFLAPTRAPHELRTALRLRAAGVPTPDVVATVVYAAGPLLRTADVASEEVTGARDLSVALAAPDEAGRAAAIEATVALLRHLDAAGARHPDLNLKNVLVAEGADGERAALVIDVDRVRFAAAGDATARAANVRRLARSLTKWRDRLAPGAADAAISRLASSLGVAVAA